MANDLFNKAKQKISKNLEETIKITKTTVQVGSEIIAREYEASGGAKIVSDATKIAKEKAEKGFEVVSDGLEAAGARKVMDRAGEKFDEVSGKKILEEVKKLIETQSIYNDVLATKLQEALDRISALEKVATKK
jgi:hypothetical protein